ncbi:MAG: hypothetical protein IJY01_04735 [Clostridia bacterium]|nr:hypothetical protein [Clostridia bacterium]
MTKKSKRIGTYLPIFLIFLIATVTIRCIALIKDFDFTSGYFNQRTLISVSDYMLIGVCVLFFTYLFIGKSNMRVRFELNCTKGYVASAVLGCATVFLGISMLVRLKSRELPLDFSAYLREPLSIVELAVFVLALLTSAYLILAALNPSRYSAGRAGFCLCGVLLFATYAAYLYFEAILPINAPNKLTDQMAYLFASLFLLFETRISLDRQTPRAYVAMGLISASVAAYSSIPSIVVYLATGKSVSNSIYDVTLTLAFCIFVCLRLISFDSAKEDEESAIVAAIRELADSTESQINLREENAKLEHIRLINAIAKREHDELLLAQHGAEPTEAEDDEAVFSDDGVDDGEPAITEPLESSQSVEDEDGSITPNDTTEDI